ncbi:hypothetical protein Lesp02_03160 [Lentzea sp. NBRC 105346]|uniref:hypothetical protein n=1 Tax=Lentzea sp. NBRC 105346 TaxID=3032205 RepID=UPI0024A461BB|nr:hypothetical protein [Lentzea sp. NBRC 105346]GLZ28126.1 hypothetical protein Lesp02_03160 [Lentzea sp. NBRC 105346]
MQASSDTSSALVPHTCQPFLGDQVDDPRFPLTFQQDPWCWTRQVGYHRASSPSVTVELTPARGRNVVVSNDSIRIDQAMSLGLGWGTCNAAPVLDDFLRHFLDLADYADFPSAEPFTRLGHAARSYSQLSDWAHRVRAQQHVLQTASRAARIKLSPPWNEILDRVQAGDPLDTRTLTLVAELGARAWRERFESDEAAQHYHLRNLVLATNGDTCVPGVRSLIALYTATLPSTSQARHWLDVTAEAFLNIPA